MIDNRPAIIILTLLHRLYGMASFIECRLLLAEQAFGVLARTRRQPAGTG